MVSWNLKDFEVSIISEYPLVIWLEFPVKIVTYLFAALFSWQFGVYSRTLWCNDGPSLHWVMFRNFLLWLTKEDSEQVEGRKAPNQSSYTRTNAILMVIFCLSCLCEFSILLIVSVIISSPTNDCVWPLIQGFEGISPPHIFSLFEWAYSADCGDLTQNFRLAITYRCLIVIPAFGINILH